MIVELELAVLILLVAPWGRLHQAWHRWSEGRKLAVEHADNEKLKLAIAREAHNADT